MRENSDDLIHSYSRKPFEKLIYSRARFKIFEQASHGNPRSSKDPRPADFIGRAFDLRAIGPIQHNGHDMLRFCSGQVIRIL